MARKLIAVALLATFASCGGIGYDYQPAPDRRSDPLSPGERGTVREALADLGLICEIGDTLDDEPDMPDLQQLFEPDDKLIRVAEKRPHGVYQGLAADQSPFDGDTMIQVLERAANEFDGCLKGQADHLRHSAELLRSVR
jgi:hypothetical protein